MAADNLARVDQLPDWARDNEPDPVEEDERYTIERTLQLRGWQYLLDVLGS